MLIACPDSRCAGVPPMPTYARGGRVWKYWSQAGLDDNALESSSSSSATKGYLRVPVDHTNASSTDTFLVKYYVDESLWGGPDSPTFITMGGEGPLGGPPSRGGFVVELAMQHKARLVNIEHR